MLCKTVLERMPGKRTAAGGWYRTTIIEAHDDPFCNTYDGQTGFLHILMAHSCKSSDAAENMIKIKDPREWKETGQRTYLVFMAVLSCF